LDNALKYYMLHIIYAVQYAIVYFQVYDKPMLNQ
jgi:hypothetical protein